MASRKPGVLDPLRVRVRRVQLVVGMGFLAFVVGAIFSSALLIRLQPRVQALGSETAALIVLLLVSRLWVWAVLPVFCYAAARILSLRPWTTALGAALTGELFLLAIDLVSAGFEALSRPWLVVVVQLATFVTGVVLGRAAVVSARTSVARAQEASERAAAGRKSQYEEFAAEAANAPPASAAGPGTPERSGDDSADAPRAGPGVPPDQKPS